ncbi:MULTISPECIES: antibiotic biosynthesis monooxygenase family protein [Pseudomonas]|uniref:antibiotic biosynthesis monooxygenase family protein n=1 Tax=Pseudomonas TaxID=286 RepID=UPI000876B7D0|nr:MULTISPECIES: antibiotic biosynthesis monooxygenase family protein [Pseudomonas]MDB6443648.1 antibiotic biosynthesis monooxygenase [Pseudomonas sp. 21TX0197]MDT8905870.1 antibiotic biosynthesis monooxygenase family protein [Pseudomonas prosekii]NHN68618.1 antibiotic biosynthesis monooxygenase [Pseudomonas fluorescens]ROO35518.1 antibiotic biosynthesis monooxygenase [Pseudomonas sp. 7SR1]ROO35556.1 antibiotic biosynthesis monooxygenase [Pseudomonas sp. AF76]
MTRQVINTVQVQAAAGRSEELGRQLQQIVETLRAQPGCDAYMVDRCPEDGDRWTVSARWQSEAAMQAHFNCPEVQGFIGLIDNRLARSVDFNSFPIV